MANTIAQKKVGSGFDISCAVFGSVLFEKVSQTQLKEIVDIYNKLMDVNENTPLDIQVYKHFVELIDKLAFQRNLKPLSEDLGTLFSKESQEYNLYLIDLSIGSDTRKMVSLVKKYWSENDTDKQNFLSESKRLTSNLLESFKKINTSLTKGKGDGYNDLKLRLKEIVNLQRKNLKTLGENSGCEIEPDFLTKVLDTIQDNDEVLMAICPGAGGWDAFVVITEKTYLKNDVSKLVKQIISDLKNDDKNNTVDVEKFSIIEANFV